MELTHSYKRQAAFTRLRSLLKEYLIRFINQNPEAFEALSRAGSPFGGNCLPMSQGSTSSKIPEATQQQLACIQQQLEVLTNQVAQLAELVSSTQNTAALHSGKTSQESSKAWSKQIGIDRFRALQALSHSLA